MVKDLWGFKDTKELEKSAIEMPDSILKEQISLLASKTNYILYGKPTFIKVRSDDISFKVATVFDVVVPALDNYSKTLLIMYSDPETEYPVAISVGKSYDEDCEYFKPKYSCDDKEEFEAAIKEILSSEEVLYIIQILYSKASMLSN